MTITITVKILKILRILNVQKKFTEKVAHFWTIFRVWGPFIEGRLIIG